MFLIAMLIVIGTTLVESWLAMLTEGALAHAMGYAIPTLSFESSFWLVVLVSVLISSGTAASKVLD